MSSTVLYVVLAVAAVAAVAAVFAFAVNVNKSKARRYFLEHYGVTDRESIDALQGMAGSVAFASLNAAAICLAVKVRSNLPDLGEDELRSRFDALWSERTIMKTAHSLELANKLGDADTFKQGLERLVRDPSQV